MYKISLIDLCLPEYFQGNFPSVAIPVVAPMTIDDIRQAIAHTIDEFWDSYEYQGFDMHELAKSVSVMEVNKDFGDDFEYFLSENFSKRCDDGCELYAYFIIQKN